MVTRVTGLVSNFDTETLVKQMMAVSQAKYDNIMKKKVETEWKKELYNDLYSQMSALEKKLFDFSLSGQNNPKTATSTNESVVSVTASSVAANVNHSISVQQLASGANMTSGDKITVAGGDSSSLASQLGVSGSMTINLSNGTAAPVSITVNSTDTIQDLVKQINDSGLGIKATYDSNLDRIFINSTNSGVDAKIDISAAAGSAGEDLIKGLKIGAATTTGGVTTYATSAYTEGKNAKFTLDGVALEQSSNDFTISGVSYSLKSTSAVDQTGQPAPTLISVKSDTSKLISNLKDIIDTYNNMLDMISLKTTEKYYRDYSPLSADQKKDMTEAEIRLWEEKARSGLLRNDSLLKGLSSKMRTAMYSAYNVGGNYKTMSSIGISTTAWQDAGKLTLDEDKLKKALADDPEAVQKLFSDANGIVPKLRSEIKSTMSDMEKKAGAGQKNDTTSSWAKEISRYTNQLDTLAAKMVTEENRYYSQFATMEKLLNNMNSTSSYLTSYFGS